MFIYLAVLCQTHPSWALAGGFLIYAGLLSVLVALFVAAARGKGRFGVLGRWMLLVGCALPVPTVCTCAHLQIAIIAGLIE